MVTDEDIKQWKPLIKKISYKYRNNPYKLDLEDIEQIGYIGLIRGLKSFNEDLGVKIKTHLYNYIKWDIDKELEYWKHNKRTTLLQSTSLDVKINDTEDLTLGEMIEDSSINIEESVINNMIIDRYRTEIIKTLTDHHEREIIFPILFNDLSIEEVSKSLKIDIEESRKIYRRSKDKIRKNMFIRSRYREYKENIRIEKYQSIKYYGNTEMAVFKADKLEQQLFKIL